MNKGRRAPFCQTLPQLFQAHILTAVEDQGKGARRKVPTGALLLLLLLLISLDRVSHFTWWRDFTEMSKQHFYELYMYMCKKVIAPCAQTH